MNERSFFLLRRYDRATARSSRKVIWRRALSALQHEPRGRGKIVATARHLFAVQGFHQTPMSELATVSGVSVGQIYRFFTGKSELIRAIIREDASAKIADMAAITSELNAGRISLENVLIQMCMQALTVGDEALSFDILAEGHRDVNVAMTIAEVCTASRSMISGLALAANPAITQDQLEGAEEMILALMFGLGHRTLSRPGLSKEKSAKSTADMILAALRSL